MSLMRHTRGESDRPESAFQRRFFADWPDIWSGWFEETLPKVEEFEEDGTIVVRAEMPGLDPEKDIEITVADGQLRITAERRQETTTDDKKGYRTEFRYGSFVRTVPLPLGTSDTDVKASYRDGILEVRLPIDTSEATARRIPVQRG